MRKKHRTDELPINEALSLAIDTIGNAKYGIVTGFFRASQCNDDPKYFQYHSLTGKKDQDKFLEKDLSKVAFSSGVSFSSREAAALKCFGEALERFACKRYNKQDIVFARTKYLKKPSLPLSSIVRFSEKQQKSDLSFCADFNAQYGWTLGKDLLLNKQAYIPAQLLYYAYHRFPKEPLLRYALSGTATATLPEAAICRSIYEIIERDAFMIFYLNKLPAKKVLIEKSTNVHIREILKEARKYNYELFLFDITTDIDIPTFLAILLDKTGIGPAVSIGAKANENAEDAMIGALEEVFNPITGMRNEKLKWENENFAIPSKPRDFIERGILWASVSSIQHISFFLNSKTVKEPDSYPTLHLSWQEKLNGLLKKFKSLNYHVYAKDITPKKIKQTAFCVYGVVIPELHPLYIWEKFAYFGGKRLYDVPVRLGLLQKSQTEEELHTFPHPFL